MMKVKLLRETFVRVPAGTVLEVSDAEGKRLLALKNGEKEAEPKAAAAAPKPAAKKKAKK